LVKKNQPNLAELTENLAGKNWRKKICRKNWREKLAGKIGGQKLVGKKMVGKQLAGKNWREKNWREKFCGKICGKKFAGKNFAGKILQENLREKICGKKMSVRQIVLRAKKISSFIADENVSVCWMGCASFGRKPFDRLVFHRRHDIQHNDTQYQRACVRHSA
jgi:hypothetical protein